MKLFIMTASLFVSLAFLAQESVADSNRAQQNLAHPNKLVAPSATTPLKSNPKRIEGLERRQRRDTEFSADLNRLMERTNRAFEQGTVNGGGGNLIESKFKKRVIELLAEIKSTLTQQEKSTLKIQPDYIYAVLNLPKRFNPICAERGSEVQRDLHDQARIAKVYPGYPTLVVLNCTDFDEDNWSKILGEGVSSSSNETQSYVLLVHEAIRVSTSDSRLDDNYDISAAMVAKLLASEVYIDREANRKVASLINQTTSTGCFLQFYFYIDSPVARLTKGYKEFNKDLPRKLSVGEIPTLLLSSDLKTRDDIDDSDRKVLLQYKKTLIETATNLGCF